MSESSFVYKIIIIGDANVGKTSTVNRWAHGWFRHDYKQTVGVQHYSRTVELGKGKSKTIIKMVIWDMAGQDIFKELRMHFYDGATGVVLMFDITRKRTFNHMQRWIDEAWESIGKRVPVVVVANKADLKRRRVTEKDITKYAKSLKAPHIITSALTGSNVTDLFELVSSIVHQETQGLVPKGHDWSKPTQKKSRKKAPKKKTTT
ncbi:MAG: Rab family GTPase [Candidatus Thorarchaeota archaeon]|jgi:Ras-related protein Rab-2A